MPVPNQNAICVGSIIGFLNVWHHTPVSPLPRRLDIIFDLKPAFSLFLWTTNYGKKY
jgi:hypothetical protein